MPGPKTHDIFYKQVKNLLTEKTLCGFPNYDFYSVFAQGHDLFLYYDFYKPWKFKRNIFDCLQLQEKYFQEFIFYYMDISRKNGALELEETRLFSGAYILHHILDSYTHPQIIYYSGDHTPNKKNQTWKHGIAETLIDVLMMERFEDNNAFTYKVYKDFKFEKLIHPLFLDTLDKSFKKIYGIDNAGMKIKTAIFQMHRFIQLLKYDPRGNKKKIFNKLDKFVMGASSFSYYVDSKEALEYLNEEHRQWKNPYNGLLMSEESFWDLYHSAMEKAARIINELELLAQKGKFNENSIFSLIPDCSSITGLKCNG